MEAQRHLVSVVVPSYKHADYVAACLRALAEQTYRPMELLIVDDDSPDDTAAVIEATLPEVSSAFERIVFHARDSNRGLVASLNEMLEEAHGEYVFQNDSDDLAAPEAVEVLVDALEQDPGIALAAGDNAIIDESGRRVYWDLNRQNHDEPRDDRFGTFAEYLRATSPEGTLSEQGFGRVHTLIRENHVPNGKLMRTSAVRAVGGWREGTVEDWDLNFRLALRFRLVFVDRVLMSYRWHAVNTIKNPDYAVTRSARTRSLLRRYLWHPVTLVRVIANMPPRTMTDAVRRRMPGAARGARRQPRQ